MEPTSSTNPFPMVAPPRELGQAAGEPLVCCRCWSVLGGLIGVGVINIYQPPIPWTTTEKIILSCLGYIVGMHVGNGLYRIKEFCKNRC